jgi:hypothetical protein
VCTQACSGDDACAGNAPALCFDRSSPGLSGRCEDIASASAPAICLAVCRIDGDCPAGDVCRVGACLSATPVQADSGAADGCVNGQCNVTTTSTPLDFLAIDAGVDFSQAVLPPPPSLPIQGATDSLVGTWTQAQCTDACWQLVVAGPDAAGAFTGYIARAASLSEAVPVSGFAPAGDASRGYPTELAPTYYQTALYSGVPGYHYSLFDGQFRDGTLSTWVSFAELWDDWCGLQTPSRVDVNGESRYVCSPEIHDTQVDLGKRVLCTAADMDATCMDDTAPGGVVPCVCMTAGSALCSSSYCQCNAATCTGALWQNAWHIDLILAGSQLSGARTGPSVGFGREAWQFTRVGP